MEFEPQEVMLEINVEFAQEVKRQLAMAKAATSCLKRRGRVSLKAKNFDCPGTITFRSHYVVV